MIGKPETLVLSPTMTVEVGVMDGYEAMFADTITGEQLDRGGKSRENTPLVAMILVQMRVYAICSLRKVNESVVNPTANIAEFARAAKMLSPVEYQALQNWAQVKYNPGDDEIKKEPDQVPSEASLHSLPSPKAGSHIPKQ